jgi:hypothetical protein
VETLVGFLLLEDAIMESEAIKFILDEEDPILEVVCDYFLLYGFDYMVDRERIEETGITIWNFDVFNMSEEQYDTMIDRCGEIGDLMGFPEALELP